MFPVSRSEISKGQRLMGRASLGKLFVRVEGDKAKRDRLIREAVGLQIPSSSTRKR
jgi:hypothetical protein